MRKVSCLTSLLLFVAGVLAGCGGGTRTVTLTTAVRASAVTVPLVVGFTESAALKKIQSAGLTARMKRRPKAAVPPAIVSSQVPSAGTRTLSDSPVTTFVSTG
jgi:beta-lactam-binding protein with PASTA domain